MAQALPDFYGLFFQMFSSQMFAFLNAPRALPAIDTAKLKC